MTPSYHHEIRPGQVVRQLLRRDLGVDAVDDMPCWMAWIMSSRVAGVRLRSVISPP